MTGNVSCGGKSFEEIVALCHQDPAGFEAWRSEQIEASISSLPPEKQGMARAWQAGIDRQFVRLEPGPKRLAYLGRRLAKAVLLQSTAFLAVALAVAGDRERLDSLEEGQLVALAKPKKG